MAHSILRRRHIIYSGSRFRNSAVHQTGFEVLIQTTFLPGTRWFEVETSPSNEEGCSATKTAQQYVPTLRKNVLTKIPFKPRGRKDCAVNANRKDSTRLSKHVVVYFYIMSPLIKSERGMSCQGRKPTESKTQPTLSSVIAKTRSRVLRSLCKYDSV